jgi:hypothetical protein
VNDPGGGSDAGAPLYGAVVAQWLTQPSESVNLALGNYLLTPQGAMRNLLTSWPAQQAALSALRQPGIAGASAGGS